jgi:hypothetical protein
MHFLLMEPWKQTFSNQKHHGHGSVVELQRYIAEDAQITQQTWLD